jgi:hypothetical protein
VGAGQPGDESVGEPGAHRGRHVLERQDLMDRLQPTRQLLGREHDRREQQHEEDREVADQVHQQRVLHGVAEREPDRAGHERDQQHRRDEGP